MPDSTQLVVHQSDDTVDHLGHNHLVSQHSNIRDMHFVPPTGYFLFLSHLKRYDLMLTYLKMMSFITLPTCLAILHKML